jgi:hypothetical protein
VVLVVASVPVAERRVRGVLSFAASGVLVATLSFAGAGMSAVDDVAAVVVALLSLS